MVQLHETLMGRKLIEHTLPDIGDQLKRIADAMDKKDTDWMIEKLIQQNPNDADLGEQIRKIWQK